MSRFLVVCFLLAYQIAGFANTQSVCFLDFIAKVYVNPERIFSEDENDYLFIDEDTIIDLSNLQQDEKGYFVEYMFPPSMNMNEFMIQSIKNAASCPLCSTPGYVAGICSNSECPGKENKQRADKQRKKEEKKRK